MVRTSTRLSSRHGPPRGRRLGHLASLLVLAAFPALVPATALAIQVTIPASKDNTLYQLASGTASNGAGEYMFSGRTKDGVRRRGVVNFDIAANVPAGSTVNSVTLQLTVARVANNTARPTSLHRLLADWGEGTSNAAQNEGQGAPPTTDDATWIHRFYPGTFWATPGGDYTATASATTSITGNGLYAWTSTTLVADVQGWLDAPATNFGWLVRGDESVVETAKRIASSENGQASTRPALIVDYTPAGGGTTGACCHADTCDVVTAAVCASLGGTYQGDNTTCTPDPCPPPGTVTVTQGPVADNTLYEDAAGALSNGAGTKLIVSRNTAGLIRRGLLRFDLSSIPSTATVQSASLTLYNAQGGTNAFNIALHRASASWGEGTSVATGTEDAGAPATTGDATWTQRFHPATPWTVPGGDFAATATMAVSVANEGFYEFASAALVADVQGWIAAPSLNHGWVVRGRENPGGNALKRFESRESTDPARRPRLVVTYVANITPNGACCLPNGQCDTLTAAECAAAGGTYQGDGTECVTDLCPVVLTPYVDALPIPAVAQPVSGTPGGAADYLIPIREVSQRLHRDLPMTRVWGYGGSYPGPTILTTSGVPIAVTWWNDLRDSLGALRTTHYLPVDACLKGPDTEGPTARIVTHLHGGHVPPESDGYPESTMLPGQQQVISYPNNQPPGTLWYHDHAMGITRLNVMMGMAGFFLIGDAFETALGLPSGEHEIGLAIQDRSFNPDGSFRYPAMWMDHFEGDKMLVNGKVWPFLQVKQGKYRFRLLNGCNSRFLRLSLSNGAPFTVIGTDLGLLPAPVTRSAILLGPGERQDVVVDFAGFAAGTQIVLANNAPAMFPGEPGVGVIPNVMRFDVIGTAGHLAPVPAALRAVAPIDTSESVISRDFTLRKGNDPCTGSRWMINDLGWDDVTEYPVLGTTEIWRFINESGISHPMHMHLVQFQVLDRQPFARVAGEIVPTGPPVPPEASEAGWKDTAPVAPGEMLRVIARFEDYAGPYAYHCHMLEHEDHEMMRQFQSVARPVASVRDSSVIEGDGPGTTAMFTVSLSSAVPVEVRVVAYTEDDSAVAGQDYTAVLDTLVFPPLTTSRTVTVPILGDLLDEYDETFRVRITSPSVAVLGDSVGVGTITDDDAAPALSVSDVVAAEGNADTTLAIFTVTLSAPSGKPVAVLAGTADGSAVSGEDYVPLAPPVALTFAAGDTMLTRSVPVGVIGDAVVEPDETFRLELSAPENAALADSSGLGTIVNDDAVPVASVDDVSVAEGDGGAVDATFTVSLSAAAAGEVRVVAFTEDATAAAGVDYTPVAADTLVFPTLTTTRTVAVPVLGDLLDEFDETFRVRLGAALGAVVGDSTGTGTIGDDDPEPSLSVSDASVVEGNADTTLAIFTMSLSARSGRSVRVLCATRNGTALSGEDYVAMAPPDTMAFAPGDTVLTRGVAVIGETTTEPNETFYLDLSLPLYATLADSVGSGTILNDDGTTGVPGEGTVPLADYLGRGVPNPFTGRVALRWGLRAPGTAEISVFDVQGRFVRRLAAGWESAGEKTAVWDGRDEGGRPVAIGVYLVRMRTAEDAFRRVIFRLK